MDILVVDGYNVIGAWEELHALRDTDFEQSRQLLIEKLAEYQAYTGHRVIVVFDAYHVRGLEKKYENYKVEVLYTKEKETADDRIEKLIKTLKNVKTQVYVATSDYAEQRTIFGQGALRKSSRELYLEIKQIEREIDQEIRDYSTRQFPPKIPLKPEVRETLEAWRRRKK